MPPTVNQRAVITVLLMAAFSTAMAAQLAAQSAPAGQAKRQERIKAFCIDFNWAPGGTNGFLEFQRRAVDRCWQRIREAAKSTRPDCILRLSCFDLRDPQVAGSKMFRQLDWLMNEHPDPASLEPIRKEIGTHTRIIQCLCGWGGHDPRRVVGDARYDDVGFYGYAAADLATTLPPHAASREVGPPENIRNIETLREVFHKSAPR